MFRIFLKRLPQLLFASYRGIFWIWHIVAIVITVVLVQGGFDWMFFQQTRNEMFRPLIMLAGFGGFFVPILLPVVMYVWGKRHKDQYCIRTSVSVIQASSIAWIIVAVYKFFTGRMQPEYLTTFGSTDISHNFQFGFFKHGIFWGWPSHHAAVAVAGATVVFLAFRNPIVRFSVLVWALIVAVGAAVGFHWLSDVIAGAIIGCVVGITVWRDAKSRGFSL